MHAHKFLKNIGSNILLLLSGFLFSSLPIFTLKQWARVLIIILLYNLCIMKTVFYVYLDLCISLEFLNIKP